MSKTLSGKPFVRANHIDMRIRDSVERDIGFMAIEYTFEVFSGSMREKIGVLVQNQISEQVRHMVWGRIREQTIERYWVENG